MKVCKASSTVYTDYSGFKKIKYMHKTPTKDCLSRQKGFKFQPDKTKIIYAQVNKKKFFLPCTKAKSKTCDTNY